MKTRQAEKSINPPSLKLRRTKKVLVFGTFDGIHPGHIFFLTEAAKLGKLTVSIASNDIVKSLKLKIPLDEKDRKNQIEKLGIASKVIIGDQKPRTWSIIKKEQPDIIAVGYDQKKFYDALKKDYKEINTPFKIVKIKSLKPHIYKSRLLHKREKICAYCTIPEIKERTILENKFAFADIAIQSIADKNRSLLFLREINKTINWEPVQVLLMEFYETGKTKEGERAYSPLLLFKCLLLQKPH